MNRAILGCALIGSFFTIHFPEAFANHVIYGLEQAKSYHTVKPGPFYVQVGAFRHPELAQQLKASLESDYKQKVRIVTKDGLAVVQIGPILSIQDIHALSPSLQGKKTTLQKKSPSLKKTKNGRWFYSADLDFIFPHLNKTITVNNGVDFPPPENVDRFTTGKSHHNGFGLQVGRRFERAGAQWLPVVAFGVKYQHIFRRDVDGAIMQYSTPEYNNYTYRWATSANVLGVSAKANLASWQAFMPYINGGIGASINHTGRYLEIAKPGITPRISPDFRTRDKTELYYEIGTGIDWMYNSTLLFSLGYDFQSFGPYMSGNGIMTWASDKLHVGRFGNSSVRLGVTYLLV